MFFDAFESWFLKAQENLQAFVLRGDRSLYKVGWKDRSSSFAALHSNSIPGLDAQ